MKESQKFLHQWLLQQNPSWSEFCFSYLKTFSEFSDIEDLFKFARVQKNPHLFVQLSRSVEVLKALLPKDTERLLRLYVFDLLAQIHPKAFNADVIPIIQTEIKATKLYRSPSSSAQLHEQVNSHDENHPNHSSRLEDLVSLHAEYLHWCRKGFLSHKSNLLSRLQEASSHRLVDEQKRILLELMRLSPKDSELQSIFARVETEVASELLSKYRFSDQTDSTEQLTVQEIEWCELIKHQMLKRATNSEILYDYVIFFEMMGAFQQALDILTVLPDSERRLLRELEVLHQAERYAEALAYVLRAESSPHLQPANLLFVKYIEALCLWNLGERERGIKLLSEIVSARSDYKNANTLLSVWREYVA